MGVAVLEGIKRNEGVLGKSAILAAIEEAAIPAGAAERWRSAVDKTGSGGGGSIEEGAFCAGDVVI